MSKQDVVTRKIYEKQHERISADARAMDRIAGLYKENTFNLDPRWFRGKEALDAGCGNVGALIARLAGLKVKKVHGIDIGSRWIPKMRKSLGRRKVPPSRFDLRPGSVLAIPFPDERFDFVAINGVLIHLESIPDIMKGFSEGARVCKTGGFFFSSYGPCEGLIQGAIFPAIRRYYRENREFKKFIDGINPAVIHQAIEKICADAAKYAGERFDKAFLKGLFGEDFCVFLQNYIQAPSWLSNECTPEFVEELYKAHGFKSVRRLNHYARRTDVRKFFAPLHFDRDYPMSRILYGRGYVQYVGQKA